MIVGDGGGAGLKMDEQTARRVTHRFEDLAAAFRTSREEIAAIADLLDRGAGEFSDAMSNGSGAFAVSWREGFNLSSRSAAVIAGNTNTFAIDLNQLDIDAGTAIRL